MVDTWGLDASDHSDHHIPPDRGIIEVIRITAATQVLLSIPVPFNRDQSVDHQHPASKVRHGLPNRYRLATAIQQQG